MSLKETENVISIEKLTKTFEDHVVLDNINLQIKKGTITSILGFSGAGKSTLLKHILGLLRPTSGKVFVLGEDISKIRGIGLRSFRRNFGMLFQYAALFDSITAFDNVAFPLREFTDMSEFQIEKRVNSLLESVGIEKHAYKRLPSELSGGMRKRVGLARGLALQPAIMLYDEPTTGLDPITTKMVNDLITDTAMQNKKRGMTSIIVSHDVRASLQISDYVAFLECGKVVECSSASEFVKSTNPVIRRFIEL